LAISNHDRVGKGLENLRRGIQPFVERELKAFYGNLWFMDGVEKTLGDRIGPEARIAGPEEERFSKLDALALLVIMWDNWSRELFQPKLGHTGRSYISELREVRNKWAHQQAFSTEDAYRALDTMQRLLEMVSAPEAEMVQASAREMMRQRFEEETRRELKKSAEIATETRTLSGLKPWREIATPHPDVAAGRYIKAEFMADLAAILSGDAEDEYLNPQEFFGRTYITEGLKYLIQLAIKRLSGQGGDPVVELQTNFGGGKTHSMISLYHLVGGEIDPKTIPGLDSVISESGTDKLPVANRAVLVGQKLNVAKGKTKPDGITTNTLWGEMAYQLGGAKGYALVAENDLTGTSPGSDTLKELFDSFSPALILIDEWVAYARQLYHVDGLPAGSFDANMTFAQALTEAAKRSPRTLVVASIPASDSEIGGEGGQAALERIRNTFGRVEAVWRPANAEESFSIVRRRLFEPMTDYASRDATCRAFADLYRQNRGEFPRDCSDSDYERKLKDCYPIHPELFDRLYQDWSTLERFQRTRGVLRLMAAVIHNLWERQDKSLLIMPGTLPLDSSDVRFEITRNLPDGWGPIIDADIDGPTSKPIAIDRENPNLGRYSACRRVARTVFIGSAPSVAAMKVRGLEKMRIKLGCVQPGEAPATFGDALQRMSEQLTYLFGNESRYWFDTHPSVNREARDRAEDLLRHPDEVELEIVSRLRSRQRPGYFSALHIAPASSSDVSDEMKTRLVVLGPRYPHSSKRGVPSSAIDQASKILNERGAGPRIYRNMLVFVAPDSDRLEELKDAVRQFLAWNSIERDKDILNLDTFQRRLVEDGRARSDEVVASRMNQTFIWLLVPMQEKPDEPAIEWDKSRINSSGKESLPDKVCNKLISDEHLIIKWSPARLKMELDRLLWKDHPHLSIRKLWEYLCTYLYLPRLSEEDVLLNAIVAGLHSKDYFAYADMIDEKGRYHGLIFGSGRSSADNDGQTVLVKPEIAQKQIDDEKKAREAGKVQSNADEGADGAISEGKKVPIPGEGLEDGPDVVHTPKPPKRMKRFFGSVELDPKRAGRDAGSIAEAVIQHLELERGANVKVTIEIMADLPEGADERTIRTVSENCKTLKFKQFSFEEE
jgi:predicted AAA+ superfamily ATPase